MGGVFAAAGGPGTSGGPKAAAASDPRRAARREQGADGQLQGAGAAPGGGLGEQSRGKWLMEGAFGFSAFDARCGYWARSTVNCLGCNFVSK